MEIITTGGSLYRRACVLDCVVAGPGGELAPGVMTVALSKGAHHMTPSYFYVEVLGGRGHSTRLSFISPYPIPFTPSIRRQSL